MFPPTRIHGPSSIEAATRLLVMDIQFLFQTE